MARQIGFVYLAYFVTAMLAEGLHSSGRLVFSAAMSTASYGVYALLTSLFYRLFKPVDATVSLGAAVFSFVGCLIGGLGVFHIALPYVNQLFFFGCYCLLLGYLIVHSVFLPRLLGALMIAAGFGSLIFLLPFTAPLGRYVEGLGILAEATLMLWLLIAGIDYRRRREQASP